MLRHTQHYTIFLVFLVGAFCEKRELPQAAYMYWIHLCETLWKCTLNWLCSATLIIFWLTAEFWCEVNCSLLEDWWVNQLVAERMKVVWNDPCWGVTANSSHLTQHQQQPIVPDKFCLSVLSGGDEFGSGWRIVLSTNVSFVIQTVFLSLLLLNLFALWKLYFQSLGINEM